MKEGIVYLVGAGPGDPGLLTLKGKAALERADVVVYDRLISRELLACAPRSAERIYVGKQAGRHALSQEGINELIADKAAAGNCVVRLKGGDPFVFGRGGEEALYCREKGIRFEVVPGVSSAVAAPAYAGIPVTHREAASGFAVITGHEDPTKDQSTINWQSIACGPETLVFLMGVGHLPGIVEQLIAHGRPGETPAALIRNGTLPDQTVVSGTLGDIVAQAEQAKIRPPAVFIVGSVVSLRDRLDWRGSLPLGGKRVVITRPLAQAGTFLEAIRALGGEPLLFPTIEIVRERDLSPLHAAFENMGTYDWIIFTSVNGVELFFDELESLGMDARHLSGTGICSIGPVTGGKLRQRGIRPDLIPSNYTAEGIRDALQKRISKEHTVLLPRASNARDLLVQDLNSRVEEIILYEARVPEAVDEEVRTDIINGRADFLTFTSSSTVRNFVEIIGREHVADIDAGIQCACIGPITGATARELGFSVAIEAETYTIEGLIEALAASQKSLT